MKLFTWLYASDWYDGPLAGKITTDEGHIFWAVLLDETWCEETEEDVRTYGLYRMPSDWWLVEKQRHRLWLDCSGNYCWDKAPGWKTSRPIQDYYDTYPAESLEVRVFYDEYKTKGTLVTTVNGDDIVMPKGP